ncbi:MAG: glucose-1-phosphate adenylyltransferase [Candidatus Wenzhouxiangella sp. M2_3B_020]
MNVPSRRFVSRLTRQTQALVLAGGRGSRLEMLTDWRAKPAVPFGGRYRIIDFALSNCLHSGIRRIGVLTQYKSHSLIRHLMLGWNTLNNDYGEFLDVIPAQQWLEDESWYQGTADAVYQSLDIIEAGRSELILVLAGDHVYKMDYGEMLAAHAEHGADITVACHDVPLADASEFGVMQVDDAHRVVAFDEKPERPEPWPERPDRALISMGLYVFSANYLHRTLKADADDPDSSHDFGKDIIPKALAAGENVLAVPLRNACPDAPYWRDVGTLDSYYQANAELLLEDPPLNLFASDWPIYTNLVQMPPAKFTDHGDAAGCRIRDSIVDTGSLVSDSEIEESVLFHACRIERGCRLDRSLVLPDCHIGAGCRLTRTLLDNGCELPPGTVIGEDPEADAARFHVTPGGVVVVNREMLGQPREYRPHGASLTHD